MRVASSKKTPSRGAVTRVSASMKQILEYSTSWKRRSLDITSAQRGSVDVIKAGSRRSIRITVAPSAFKRFLFRRETSLVQITRKGMLELLPAVLEWRSW